MGRPINKKYFVRTGSQTIVDTVQYEGVTFSLSNGGTHYSQGAIAVVSAPNTPNVADGVNATVTLVINTTTGVISSAAINNTGAGYNANPTVTISKPGSVNVLSTLSTTTSVISGITTTGIYVGMRMDGSPGMPANNYVTIVGPTSVTGTYNFTSNTTTNVTFSDQGSGFTYTTGLTHAETDTGTIYTTAWIPAANGGTSAVKSAILKQKGARTYVVENDQNGLGTGSARGVCKLTTATSVTVGTMQIVAKDLAGNSYTVQKLTAHKVSLWRKTGSGSSWQFANDSVVGYTFGWANATSTKVGIQTN